MPSMMVITVGLYAMTSRCRAHINRAAAAAGDPVAAPPGMNERCIIGKRVTTYVSANVVYRRWSVMLSP